MLDNWLPSQAATWDDGTGSELLLQLAGHLRGCERNFLDENEKSAYDDAIGA